MNKIKSILIMSILLGSIFMILSPVSAATYNVYESDGWQVLHDTIQNAPSGSTIYVHAGIYYIQDPIDIMNYSNITVIGDSPLNTIIDATSSGGDGFLCTQNYFTIKNITVRNAPYTGIRVSDYSLVENCIVHSNDDGIYIAHYSTVKNCLVYGNSGRGISINQYCEAINCTSAFNGRDGIEVEDYCKVYNCIFAKNGDDGFDIDSVGIYVYNSNSWGNADYDWYDDGGVHFSNCISVDPKFANGINTFYLSPGSPCVDKGSASSSALGLYQGFTTRTDGRWDTGTVDMGFHYASNRGPPSSLPIAKILEILKGNQEE
ncbi:MAG: Pectate lyase superfamily protein [Candidatus Methanofastidiosum methylothiophilum]|uniref:Pectate lyase superfamily protein n=1 Tax=Candidatus Methanofastidiosum methylothiophilum TaxID=1705564 RepID=A0A150J6H8_9EURY|nr:MAG: Pectate lyase superfamily protein [Candidatus Methanofastidiosum methylthiophilus]